MRLAPLVFVLSCALVLFTGLDRPGFTDVREARDAQVARELLAGHDGLAPTLGGEPLADKPVLAYAPDVMLARHGHDATPFAIRLTRAALALALALLTYSVGARHFGPRAGWSAAAALVTTFGLAHAVRTDTTQLLATTLGWVGAAGFADALSGRPRGRGARLVVAWGALAVTAAVAGPLPALWPLGALALHATFARPLEGTRTAHPARGVPLLLAFALPWYGALVMRHGTAALAHAAWYPYGAGTPGPWFGGALAAVSLAAVGAFPWGALLPEALRHAGRGWRHGHAPLPVGLAPLPGDPVARERREESAAHFLVACLLAASVPLALYPGPPLTAALPLLPAAALLCGRFLDHLAESPAPLAGPLGRATLMLAATGSVAALLFAALATRLPAATRELHLLAALTFATAWLPFLARLAGRPRLAALLFALPVALGAPVAALRVLPALEDTLNARAVAEALDATAPAGATLVLDEAPPPSLRLYAHHPLAHVPALAEPLDAWRASDSLVYAAFRPGRERAVTRGLRGPIEIVLRTPALVLARLHPGG
jgi:4-amino-4-deoxy-L-arabinose transferase-like glycosyltransferase